MTSPPLGRLREEQFPLRNARLSCGRYRASSGPKKKWHTQFEDIPFPVLPLGWKRDVPPHQPPAAAASPQGEA